MTALIARIVKFVLGRPTWQLYAAAIVAVIVFLATLIARHDAGQRDEGAQAIRDSISAVTTIRQHRHADSLIAAADSAVAAARDTATKVEHVAAHLQQRIADLERSPLPIAVTHGDTVTIAPDTTHYIAPHPVAVWVSEASVKIAKQDSTIADAKLLVLGIPSIRDSYERALAKQDSAATARSLAAYSDGYQHGLTRGRATVASPSTVHTVLTWAFRAGLVYGGYRLGRGR